ncbi:MAG: TIGR03643 family protein [Flavobacteriaceae bacterium]
MKKLRKDLTPQQIDRIIEMAWEDRTPFDAIQDQFGLKEQEVITLMRREMKASSFRMWRARVQGRKTKHRKSRSGEVDRFRCSRQKGISNNKISKR